MTAVMCVMSGFFGWVAAAIAIIAGAVASTAFVVFLSTSLILSMTLVFMGTRHSEQRNRA